MNQDDVTSPVEPADNWPGHLHHPEASLNKTDRLATALKYLQFLLLALAVLAAVLNLAAVLADPGRP
ncbi:hypothetical protein [Streptomyces enissocaesilis]|uniref:Uncharacterized protein n=1 Tax=Streptomyces enissocaesilis TaxID=332589 RepID=A0ABN3X4W8_9ACTN